MGLLYNTSVHIAKGIDVRIPTLREILPRQDEYYDMIYQIIATPSDLMVQLEDAKIDFTKISDFELFCILFHNLKEMDTGMIFEDLSLADFEISYNQKTSELVLLDQKKDVIIDRVIHYGICECLRNMLYIQKKVIKPGNKEAKDYLLDRERKKLKRANRRAKKIGTTTQMENHIIALVNTEQFPYTYESVQDLTIFQFNASLNQIAHKIRYDNTMIGYYSGTIKGEDLPQEDKSWIKTESN